MKLTRLSGELAETRNRATMEASAAVETGLGRWAKGASDDRRELTAEVAAHRDSLAKLAASAAAEKAEGERWRESIDRRLSAARGEMAAELGAAASAAAALEASLPSRRELPPRCAAFWNGLRVAHIS